MTTKQKELRKQRIKNILLKTLHIVCYILSALFIIICFIGGVKSCEKKPQSVSAETETRLLLPKKANFQDLLDEYSYSYRQAQSDTFNMSLSAQVDLLTYFDIPIGIITDPSATSIIKTFYTGEPFAVYRVGDSTPLYFDTLYYRFVLQSTAQNNKLYRLYAIYPSGWSLDLVLKDSSSADDYNYHYAGNFQFLFKDDSPFLNVSAFTYFYQRNSISNFTFNKQFNYNAPLNTNILGLYGSMTFDTSGANIRWKNYNVGYFYSNGQIFNQIQYTCVYSDASSVIYQDGTIDLAPSGYWIYGWLSYVNTDTNHSEIVNRHDQQPYNHNGGYTYYYANSSTWTNDAFRYITFLQSLSESLTITINSFNNNNQNYYSGQIYTDGSDVFTLLSLGFSSLNDFWQLQILPSISIGVLFFLPAVVGIIVTIVHLLRK